MLRPATFARLSEVLHEAADAGRPYHVVHFDGHGTYLDLAHLQPGADDGGSDGGQAAAPAAAEAGRSGCRRCGTGSRWRARCGRASTGT